MTDETIMAAVRNGNLKEAALLFDRYHRRIFNFLVTLTGDRDAAEDLTQNVFYRLIKYRNSFKDDSRFQPWIYQIARNVFSDHYKAQKHFSNTIDVDKVSENIPEREEGATLEEKEQLLHKCLNRLGDDDRELLILTRFQHLKYEEVATILDTTVANIKVKVHRAIGKLREYYFELDKV
jgi:RNA polymerase sigma factor (sigma-70 family)